MPVARFLKVALALLNEPLDAAVLLAVVLAEHTRVP
jgi:hypothetical protein